MRNLFIRIILLVFIIGLGLPLPIFAQADFNPNFIISDEEMQSAANWTTANIQKFLEDRGSYLANMQTADATDCVKPVSQIIYEAAVNYQINPKYLLVTLQKEQSLITDDSPTQKQLDWATGYGVCDSCSLSDPNVLKHKGFGKQVDNAAGVIRWYYDNSDRSFVKKKDQPTVIDSTTVVPQSWATAFLYTYTPHLHGNKNFWRIWNTWFSQIYPNGSLLQSASSNDVWLIQNGVKRKFINQAALLSRADPKMIITVPDSELNNYQTGVTIAFPNYSILKSPGGIYLLDYDTLRPFASEAVVKELGYNPQEIIEVADADITGYPTGDVITTSSTAPQGIIYQIVDNGTYYLYKDNTLYPIVDKSIVQVNYKSLPVEKHKLQELSLYRVADLPIYFKDGTLLKINGSNTTYVMENGKKRRIADSDTFAALGYKESNITSVPLVTAAGILDGEPLFLNSNLLSARDKFLGDSESKVDDLYGSKLPAYVVAEYPSGRIVSGKDIDKPRPIASLVKLLTAYEALSQNFDLAKASVYDPKKYGSSGQIMKLRTGAKIKNSNLLYALLIDSANNIARMVAQKSGLGEKAFIASVNQRLENWGADDTSIADVTGLSEKNKSTPRNLLKIFTKVIENKDIKSALSKSKYTFKELPSKNGALWHTITNTNQLLASPPKDYKIIASKTGYTDEAGAVLLMLVESTKTKKQYTIITLGNTDYKNRFREPDKIARWISTGNIKIANK